jgi:polynucleotide 5'-hydroxyl-kinase GRC3/NOL9
MIPDEWSPYLDGIIEKGRIIIVIGAVDTGKTTLVHLLANLGTAQGLRVGVVDADIGQSDIGPPTSIGLGIIDHPVPSLSEIKPSSLYFVGSTSPGGHLLPMVVGTKEMVDHALELGAEKVIIDTTGLVYGGIGRALKHYMIANTGSDLVIVLERRGELEHIVKSLEGREDIYICRLKVPPQVKRREPDLRRENRRAAFRRYFDGAHSIELLFEKIRTTGTPFLSGRSLGQGELRRLSKTLNEIILYGERVDEGVFVVVADKTRPKDGFIQATKEDFISLLIGLVDRRGKTLSLGVIQDIDFLGGRILVRTPLESKDHVSLIQFGSIKLEEE